MKVRISSSWLCSALIAFALPLSAFADGGCTGALKQTETKVGNLSTNGLSVFFRSFNKGCLKSVEFSEWSNELLFAVLAKQPVEFLGALEKQDEEKVKAILSKLESPINDGIDVGEIHATVKSAKTTSKMKQRILQALQVAGNKSGMVLK